MSLVRLAFWLALVVLLLPTDAQQQARLSNFANAATERLATFCDRNGKTCSVSAELWAIFLKKAEFGVRLVGDLLGANGRQQAPQPYQQGPYRQGPYAPTALPDKRAGKADSRGTLQPSDLYQPPWRGPARPGGR